MDQQSTYRSDDQLLAMLQDTGEWLVNGPDGEVLREVANLHDAIETAEEYAASGRQVRALTRQSPSIIVFNGQIDRLVEMVIGWRDARGRRLHATGE